MNPPARTPRQNGPSIRSGAGASSRHAGRPTRPGTTVLIVEDDWFLALALSQSATAAGGRVLEPRAGYVAALRAVAHDGPTHAVIDIDLGAGDRVPGCEGERLLAVLTAIGCRCVVHSGRTELFPDLRARFSEAVLIPKPADPADVVGALLGPAG